VSRYVYLDKSSSSDSGQREYYFPENLELPFCAYMFSGTVACGVTLISLGALEVSWYNHNFQQKKEFICCSLKRTALSWSYHLGRFVIVFTREIPLCLSAWRVAIRSSLAFSFTSSNSPIHNKYGSSLFLD
jgi:hypothetical protein